LTAHHGIEERYFFPMLVEKMPAFQTQHQKSSVLLQQHVQIHKGTDELEAYLEACLRGEKEMDMRVLKQQMDAWKPSLLEHLDLEEKTIGAENMRNCWTPEEVESFPI
jgi:hemerythrin-like domain-containing protein